MADVPEAQPIQPAPEPRPEPPHAQPFEAEAPPERWNPFKTPFAYLVLAAQIAVVAYAAHRETLTGGPWDNYAEWLHKHGWTFDDMTQVVNQPWKLLTCLVVETLPIQVLMNVM